MANKKFTDLPAAGTITGAEILAMVQGGDSVQGDIDLIKAYFDTLYPTMVYTAPASVTPTFTGFGTVSGVNCYTWRVGAYLYYELVFTSGISTATEARFGLRYNSGSGEVDVTTASSYPTLQIVGIGGGNTQVTPLYALAEAGKTYLAIGYSAAADAPLVKRNANLFSASGWVTSFSGAVRIQGW